jgi:hypothetical protein
MAARTLEQIINELNTSSQPQIDSMRNRKQGLAGELQADEQALAGQQNRAFTQITDGARRRGLGFSGIPLGEQAQYASDVYLPSLTRARNDFRNRELSLEDAIQGVFSNNRSQGQSIYQAEQDRAEQIRQYNENMAFQREQAARAARAAAGNGAPAWLQALLGGSQSQATADDADARYKAWLASQKGLKVTTAPQQLSVTGNSSRFGSGGVRLQGGGVASFGSGGLSLQGNRSTSGLTLPTVKKKSGLSVISSPNQSRVTVR